MPKETKREARRQQKRRERRRTYLIWGGVGLLAVIGIGWIGSRVFRPAAGEATPLMDATHIAEGTNPGDYNSDPPTSGPHYPSEYQARFYEEADLPGLAPFHEGFLVHNLEHGYVIFWYNCDLLDETGCTNLKEQIKTTMDGLGGAKLIAYPWPSLDVPLVMTSWGRLQRFETFDLEQAKAFYRANLNRAPEPNAP